MERAAEVLAQLPLGLHLCPAQQRSLVREESAGGVGASPEPHAEASSELREGELVVAGEEKGLVEEAEDESARQVRASEEPVPLAAQAPEE